MRPTDRPDRLDDEAVEELLAFLKTQLLEDVGELLGPAAGAAAGAASDGVVKTLRTGACLGAGRMTLANCIALSHTPPRRFSGFAELDALRWELTEESHRAPERGLTFNLLAAPPRSVEVARHRRSGSSGSDEEDGVDEDGLAIWAASLTGPAALMVPAQRLCWVRP